MNCGACARICPSNCMDESDPRPKTECLSAITQKKGELTDKEIEMMLKNGSIWGCDVCQNVCPYTKNASFTPISYFDEGIITQSLPVEAVDKIPSDMLTNSLETIRTFYDRELSNTSNVYNLAIILSSEIFITITFFYYINNKIKNGK